MDLIMIPGFWLDASSWDRVVPTIERAGHRVHALTLPGMESKDAQRSNITLRDHVDAVVAVIDSIATGEAKLVLVGHSGGGAVAHAAADARPHRVARVIYVDSGPLGDGAVINDGLPEENGEIPLPDWTVFDDADLVDMDDEIRAQFRERAIPTPARVAQDRQQLSDDRRYDVPVTVIACEFPSAMLKEWMAQGHTRSWRSSRGSRRSSTSTCPPATGRSSLDRSSSLMPSAPRCSERPARVNAHR